MSLVFTRKNEPKNNPRFCITVQWEHGDADHNSYDTTQFPKMSKEEFLEWVAKFRAMAEEVNSVRQGGKWQGFEHWEKVLSIEIERDAIYNSSDDPAHPYLDKVEYVDYDDVRYTVSGY